MRARTLVWLIAALAACDESGQLDVTDPDGSGDDSLDTDGDGIPDDTDGTDTGDDARGPEDVARWHHVIADSVVLPADQGFDLDGDGTPDNALGNFAGALGDGLGALLADAETLVVLQSWGVDDRNPELAIGLLAGGDTDGDPSDNFDGSEVYAVSEGLRPSGRAVASAFTTPDDEGVYEVVLDLPALEFGGVTVPTANGVWIAGVSRRARHEGVIGMAVPTRVITDLLDSSGLGFLSGVVVGAADVDSDGDQQDDAISLAIRFEAVPCEIERAP